MAGWRWWGRKAGPAGFASEPQFGSPVLLQWAPAEGPREEVVVTRVAVEDAACRVLGESVAARRWREDGSSGRLTLADDSLVRIARAGMAEFVVVEAEEFHRARVLIVLSDEVFGGPFRMMVGDSFRLTAGRVVIGPRVGL